VIKGCYITAATRITHEQCTFLNRSHVKKSNLQIVDIFCNHVCLQWQVESTDYCSPVSWKRSTGTSLVGTATTSVAAFHRLTTTFICVIGIRSE